MATQVSETKSSTELVISWEVLPDNFQLKDEPVKNTGQPILAGALRESLEISGFIQCKKEEHLCCQLLSDLRW